MAKSRFESARRFLRSNLLGLVAIFIVLGGTAIALPGKNKVDSGDIKQGAVRTLDLHRDAVTKTKLRRNAVDDTRVRNDSLTGDDIDESTLELPPLKAGAVTDREEADRERRIAIPPAALMPQFKGPPEEPQFTVDSGLQSASFYSDEINQATAMLQVPLDRAASSGLQVRLLWDANEPGTVFWNVGFQALAPGTALKGAAKGTDVSAIETAPGTLVETIVLDIPAGAVQNGVPLGLTITRNSKAPGDTVLGFARLRMVEIRYTATG